MTPINTNKPVRHKFRNHTTVTYLGSCDDPRWPLMFGVKDETGTTVIQTDRNGCMTVVDYPVIENTPEITKRYANVYSQSSPYAGEFYRHEFDAKKHGASHSTGVVELTFEDNKLTGARVC